MCPEAEFKNSGHHQTSSFSSSSFCFCHRILTLFLALFERALTYMPDAT